MKSFEVEENKSFNNKSVKSLNESGKISKKQNSKFDNSNNSIKSKIILKKNQPNLKSIIFEEVSEIIKKEEYFIDKDFNNSLFNEDKNKSEESGTKQLPEIPMIVKKDTEMSDYFQRMITNAEPNDTIILPEGIIQFKYLVISKPIKIKGKAGCIMEITEGPIIINIDEKYENEIVKFSELLIHFNLNKKSNLSSMIDDKDKKEKKSFLFKLNPGSLLEIEDCDLSCNGPKSSKIVCFQVSSKVVSKKISHEKIVSEENHNKSNELKNNETNSVLKLESRNNYTSNISVITLRSSKFSKFYQTMRAGQNTIINIEKCFINNNSGKAIALINPLIVKIVDSVIESNMDNAIHIRFLKDSLINFDSRKVYLQGNELCFNFGYGVYIDGIESFHIDLSIAIYNNSIRKNRQDGIFLNELNIDSLIIEGNTLKENKSNGLNLQKIQATNNLSNSTNSQGSDSRSKEHPQILVKGNTFCDSEGFGVFSNDSKVIFLQNEFLKNKASGLILCNINFSELYKDKSTNINTTTSTENSGHTYIQYCNFTKNGGNGLKIFNYSFSTSILNSKFCENCEFGMQIENEISGGDKEKNRLQTSKSENQGFSSETNIYIKNCHIKSNMKSGLSVTNNYVFLDHTEISHNLDFAILIPKEENKKFIVFQDEKESNLIQGSLGGSWGKIVTINQTSCSGCSSSQTVRKLNKNSLKNDDLAGSHIKKNELNRESDEKCLIL